MKYFLKFIFALLLFSISFEAFSFIFFVNGADGALAPRLPSYHWENVKVPKEVKFSPTEFGYWYRPNLDLRISFNRFADCELYELQTNSYGARDKERALYASQSRIIVLGDTILEGMGVAAESRTSDLLESRSGLEHLNFSMKNTGSLHHLAVYETLASNYEHDALIIGLFPYNDFIDASLEKKQIFDPSYSGYFLTGDYPNYERTYVSGHSEPNSFVFAEALLHEFSYSWHMLIYLRNRGNTTLRIDSPASYYNFSQEDFLRFSDPIHKIAKVASDKQIYLLSFPFKNDLETYQENPASPFSQDMGQLAAQYDHVTYFDLLPHMSERIGDSPIDDYYYACNREHYSKEGYAMAADIIFDNLDIYQTPSVSSSQAAP